MKPIRFPLNLQAKGTEVARLQDALVFLDFTIAESEQSGRRYGATTRAAVASLQKQHGLSETGQVDQATAEAINGLLAEHGVLDPDVPPGVDRRVTGTVLHTDGSTVSGIPMEAFHRQVGGELPLGQETLTNDRGQYAIGYELPDGISKIDLFVRAYGDKRAIIAVSPIIIGAGAEEVLDLSVTDPKFRGPSEFGRVTPLIGPAVRDIQLGSLDANDVALLVRTTGLPRQSVTAWIAARRLAERTEIDHESLYGLVRSENTAALPRLLRRSAARLQRSLAEAAESNIISFDAGQQAPDTVRRLRQLAVKLSTSHETLGSLGLLLATCTAASAAQQARFIERYAEHDGPVQALWTRLRKDPGFGDAVVDDLQLSLRLGTLAANHPPLVQALRASGVKHAGQTVTLDTDGWRQLLQTQQDGKPVGTPPNIKGRTDAERQDNYITLLKERGARAYPTATVAKTLKTLPTWKSSSAVAFLDTNPDFNLVTANIKANLDAGDVVVQLEWDRAELATELGTVQRIARVAPRGREETTVNALLQSGYTSALSISRQSRAQFKRKTAAAFGDEAMADTVYRNAQFQVSRAANAFALLHPTLGGGYINAIGTVSTEVESDPTWASLFGNVDYCRCDHCRSIHSPAAYLVALLGWLDEHDSGAKTAFDLLTERRPDIQRIELTCENTNTMLPYTDLVTEILEVRVLNSSPSGNPANVPRATTATSPELLADPEYLKPLAYDQHLAKAVFPHPLPFDLWGALGRVYFEHLGVRRSDLMETLSRRGTPQVTAIDAERLEFSTTERRILTGAAQHDVWEYWGYSSATPDGSDYKLDLAVVSHFLDRAAIGYDQLLDLLHSRFVSPGGIRITGAEDNTDEMTITPMTDEVVGRMHLFLRLWRNRGWTMLDLDKTLKGLGISRLDAAGLGRLADLDRVLALTRAPLLEALSWWGPMDTVADRPEKEQPVKSLYDRVYLNRAVDATAEEPEFPLALNLARTALANTVNWDDVRSILQAALVIDANELALLLDETVDGLPNEHRVVTGTTASLEGLSALYRHVSLARRLKLTVSELPGWLRLVGVDPFDVAHTKALVTLVETTAELWASDFSLLDLHYLLEHDAQAEVSVGVTDEAIGQILVEIRDGLTRVAADHVVTTDPVGEITAQHLAVILDADAVSAVMTALQTEADTANHLELETVLTTNLGDLVTFDATAVIKLAVADRFTALLKRLAPFLQETQGNAVIIEKTAGFAGRDLDSVQDLLALRLRMSVGGGELAALDGLRNSPFTLTALDEIVPADDPAAFAALRRIFKAASVFNKLGIEMDAQAWLFDVGVRNGLLDPLALPIEARPISPGSWEAWSRLLDLSALASDLPGAEPSLVELLLLLESTDEPGAAEEAFLTELAIRTGWLRPDLDVLIAAFGPAYPAGWRDGRTLRQLTDGFALIERLGVSAAQADSWAISDIGSAQAEELRLAAKSKHDEERWPAIARALRDPVREQQRAGLVAFLIAQEEKYVDADDLYSDLLIDVQMAPCMLTSRIKQAISSVQLFVQRAFLNLEDKIELSRDARDQWEWMKNYRVWEAARKVFLFPENWAGEPELRLDKSPLFEQLENTLQQGELNDAAAEKAYTEYLEGLLKVARVEVMGLYHQLETDDDGTVDLLHVVARTKSQPHEYYYRQWIDGREWSPWESLDADIEGEHVILAVHDRRVFLFWPLVVQKASADASNADENNPPIQTDFYEMKLAWIERMNDRWGARKLSSDALVVHDGTWAGSGEIKGEEFLTYFRLGEGSELRVECRYGYNAQGGQDLLGTFVVDGASGTVFVDRTYEAGLDLTLPALSRVGRMRFRLSSGSASSPQSSKVGTPFVLSSADSDESGLMTGVVEEIDVLGKVDGKDFGTYVYPHQYGEFASQHGVFLDDDDRTFHVMPEPALKIDQVSAEDSVDPSGVGTTQSESDVIVTTEEDSEFEPELPWDKTQEPAITSNERVARLAQRANRSEPVSAGAATSAAAFAEDLTLFGLQQSQSQLSEVAQTSDILIYSPTHKYRFSLFYHPYAGDFMTELRRSGVSGLLDPNPDGSAPRLVRQAKSNPDFFGSYLPTASVLDPPPIQDIDFEIGGAYARYNMELFFHAPLMIANRLSANQRFGEARRWFHFMFDPTNPTPDEDPLRFWKIKPFYRLPDAPIADFLALAASDEDSPEVVQAREDYDRQIEASIADPFNVHRIAELRTTAYQKTLVMKYLDNLIAWGDQLFRQDTIESINEATQLYVLALDLLGERPDALPPRSTPAAITFEEVRGDLAGSVLNNPLVQLENLIFQPRAVIAPTSAIGGVANSWASSLFPRPTVVPGPPTFYFCIPPNDKLLGYWDDVEDRLFKIRNCMNIQGVVRQLPLFEPPIDPGMLVRARAAGIDLSSALADLNAPLPYYRFSVMLQKSYALNQTVRALGSGLLSALEKNDAEAMGLLRANDEVALLDAVRQVKKLAIEEAGQTLAAAERSLTVVEQRRDYYQQLIGAGWLPGENQQKDLMTKARAVQLNSSRALIIGGGLAMIPEVVTGASGWAGSPVATSTVVAGLPMGKAAELGGQALAMDAAAKNAEGAISGLTAGHLRREQEWQNQLELSRREISQIEKQIEAAKVRVALAERDLDNHERQIDNARSVRDFMEQKFTNVELYQWMVGQLSTLYFQSYQLAYDLAKQAERAYRHELALPEATFIQFGYWDSLRKGLLAGERLQYDLERMDTSYLATNVREYEITRHVSLAMLDPVALTQLQTAGGCEFSIPEALYDIDYPGLYLRRIKSVSVTVPCVTGPYTGVPMRLTLVSSRTRVDPSAAGDYPMDSSAEDPRFQFHTGAVQSIVINSGRDDAGLFAADHRDERYLPFEGCGAISDWNLALTSAVPTFDWRTITDVVLHVRHTAREGGELLREAALTSLDAELDGLPLRRAFSARSEFGSQWNAFLRPPDEADAVLSVELTEQLFPYIAHGAGLEIINLELIALVKDPRSWRSTVITVTSPTDVQQPSLTSAAALYGGQPSASMTYGDGIRPGRWEIAVPTDPVGIPADWADDLILIATYQLQLPTG